MKTDAIIFDASNAAHRISAASAPLTNAKGVRVEVVFGLLRLMSSVMRANPSKKCFVVWDGKNSRKIRQSIDPLYKCNREKDRDEDAKERIKGMHEQISKFWELFGQHLPINWLISEKYEADDIIAMLSNEEAGGGMSSLIVSGDKDLLQLVSEFTSVYSPNGDKYCQVENFSKYTAPKGSESGFPNNMSWLYAKCLMGDSSDNVKGVGGVGEITALRILAAHDWDITNLLTSPADELIRSKVGQTILSTSGKARIALNYKLMSLHGKAHRRIQPEVDWLKGTMNTRELRTNLAKMQFASLMATFTQFISPFQLLEA